MAKKRTVLSVHITDREQLWGIAYLLLSLFLLPELLNALNGYLPLPLGKVWLNFLYFSVNFLCILWIFHGFFHRSLCYISQNVGRFLLAVLLGFGGYWLCSWCISLLYRWLFPGFANLNDGSITVLLHDNFWITAIGTVLLVPITEEALHRGLIFGSLYQKSHLAAYLLSSAIFSAVHIMGYADVYSLPHLLLAFAQYLPAGLALALAYRKSGSIFAPVLIHTMINAVGLFALR